jgi:RNA polymerase sigma factor (sigma-70 family)
VTEEPDTFEAVYARERLAATRLAHLLVRSRPVAEELAQEAFLRLYRHFPTVENPAGFVRTAVVRLAINDVRRRDMERDRLRVVAGGDPDHAPAPGGERDDELLAALGRLRPLHRAVLVLRFYEDLSHDQIAELLGCPTATVRSRTRRALAGLRREMRKETPR